MRVGEVAISYLAWGCVPVRVWMRFLSTLTPTHTLLFLPGYQLASISRCWLLRLLLLFVACRVKRVRVSEGTQVGRKSWKRTSESRAGAPLERRVSGTGEGERWGDLVRAKFGSNWRAKGEGQVGVSPWVPLDTLIPLPVLNHPPTRQPTDPGLSQAAAFCAPRKRSLGRLSHHAPWCTDSRQANLKKALSVG